VIPSGQGGSPAISKQRAKFKEILERRTADLLAALDYLTQLGLNRGRAQDYEVYPADVEKFIRTVEQEPERMLDVWRKEPGSPRFSLDD
jgi:hypothetical protein